MNIKYLRNFSTYLSSCSQVLVDRTRALPPPFIPIFLFLVEDNIYIKYLFVKVTRSFGKVLQVACLFAKVLFYNLTSLFVKKNHYFPYENSMGFLTYTMLTLILIYR